MTLTVRLHDDVRVGPVVVRAGRVLRFSPTARSLLVDREIAATDPARAALVDRLVDLDLAAIVPAGPPVSLSEVTVVVPVHDDPDGIARLLPSLRGMEVLVVDDASRDPAALADVVRRHGARLLRLEVNVGPAAARNAGLREVKTPVVAFVDADMVVTPAALTDLLVELTEPKVALCAPRVRTHHGKRWFERYEDARGALDLGPVSAQVRPMSPVTYVPTACLLARTDVVAGGFDERMRSGEDVDLVWRMLDRGWRVRYRADVHAWHGHRSTVRSWLGRKVTYGLSAAPLGQRHGAAVAPAVLWPEWAVLAGAALAQRRWSVPVIGAVLARSYLQVGRALPDTTRRQRAELLVLAARTTASQGSALLLRHWWPMTAAVAARSSRVRRVVVTAALADALVTYRSCRPALDPLRFGLARRLDDLAYGTGVWAGVLRTRSLRPLLPAAAPRLR